jgi:hypothetical protein
MTTQTAHLTDPQTGTARRMAFKGLIGLLALVMAAFGGKGIITGWFSPMDGGIHRWHEIAWGVIEGVLILTGLVALLWRARHRIAAMQQVIAGCLALIATMALARVFDPFTGVFIALVAIAALLHPARSELLALRGQRIDPAMLGLAAVAAVPLALYSLGQIRIDAAAASSDSHAAMAHYAGTTAAALGIPLVAALAALRTRGWAIPRWSAVAAAGALGLASLVYPGQESSFGVVWGAGAIAWAATFAVAGHRAEREA